jgi:hypothetical protein
VLRSRGEPDAGSEVVLLRPRRLLIARLPRRTRSAPAHFEAVIDPK